MTLLACLVAATFAGLAVLHLYWVAGGRWGLKGVIPQTDGKPLIQPGPAATVVVACLLALAAVLVLGRAGIGPVLLPAFVRRWGTWGVGFVLTARAVGDFNYIGLFKRPRATLFARLDTRYFSPLALALGVGAGIVALTGS